MEQVFDIAIIGSGPGGYVAGLKAGQLGAKVAVIEADLLGGTCLNRGCIPSKALLSSAELLHRIRTAKDLGVSVEGKVGFDWTAIQARKDRVLARLRSGIKGLFAARNVTLVLGKASLAGPGRLVVQTDGQTRTISAKKIIIASGSVPATIPGWPDDQHYVCTSDQALHWKDLPGKVLIVGGGVIGCEFACMLRGFGVDVTVVEMLSGLLPGMEPGLGRALAAVFAKRGIKVFLDTKVDELKIEDGIVRARLSNGQALEVDRVLVATGRRPNTAGLGLDRIGLDAEKGFVKVNDRMQTMVPDVYCIGDANGRCMLAHAASAQGICAVEDALGHGKDMRLPIPSAVYTFPQVASVGLTSIQAKQQGLPIKVGYFPIGHLGKAQASGEEEGFVLVIRHRQERTLLGVHIIGAHATELIGAAVALIGQDALADDLGRMVFAHPTIGEAVKEAAEDSLDQALHLPPRKLIRMLAEA